MTEPIKGPWPLTQPGPSHHRNRADAQTQRQVMEEYWRTGKMQNPMHLNRPVVLTGHENSQPSLALAEGEIVTDGGRARAHMLNFMKAIRGKEDQ